MKEETKSTIIIILLAVSIVINIILIDCIVDIQQSQPDKIFLSSNDYWKPKNETICSFLDSDLENADIGFIVHNNTLFLDNLWIKDIDGIYKPLVQNGKIVVEG